MKNNQAENPNENKNFSEEFTKVSEHARAEISWVRSAYKFAFGFIITGVTILLGLGIYFTYQNTHDLKADMQKDADTMRASLHTDFDTLKQQQQQDLAAYLTQMHDEITKRIDTEFADSNIITLVHEQAKERIDSIADKLIETDITNRIAPIRAELLSVLLTNIDDEKKRIADINKTANESYETETNLQTVLIDAKSTLKRLDEQSDFVMTVLAAENDDRSAFEKLRKFGNDPSYSFHDLALKSMETIIGKYFGDNSETDKAWRNLGWVNSVKPNTFDINQIEENWRTLPAYLSRAYVDFVWGHTNITKAQKLTFLHDMLTDSRNSLKGEDKAARILAGEFKAIYNPPFDFSDIEQKWNEWEKTNQPPITGTNVSNQK